jgi:small subunit ribosomal protein S20
MANIKSAKKAAIQNEKRRLINQDRRSDVKTSIKKVLAAISKGEAIEQVKSLAKLAESKLARAKNKIYHANASDRKVSRLAKRVSDYCRAKEATK